MNCGIAQALEALGDWWTLLIVRDAFFGARRFGDFEANLGIAKNILSDRLQRLVEHGIFAKLPVGDSEQRFEYRLSPKGEALLPVLTALRDWSDEWIFGEGNEPVVIKDRRSNQPIPRLKVEGRRRPRARPPRPGDRAGPRRLRRDPPEARAPPAGFVRSLRSSRRLRVRAKARWSSRCRCRCRSARSIWPSSGEGGTLSPPSWSSCSENGGATAPRSRCRPSRRAARPGQRIGRTTPARGSVLPGGAIRIRTKFRSPRRCPPGYGGCAPGWRRPPSRSGSRRRPGVTKPSAAASTGVPAERFK